MSTPVGSGEGFWAAVQLEEDSVVCAICLAALHKKEDLVGHMTPSGRAHVFHVQCLEEWIATSAMCPTCRLPISNKMSLLQEMQKVVGIALVSFFCYQLARLYFPQHLAKTQKPSAIQWHKETLEKGAETMLRLSLLVGFWGM